MLSHKCRARNTGGRENALRNNKNHNVLFLSEHLRDRFGQKVRKVPLDAGFTCPNRDGTLSRKGCAFCDARGSGTGLFAQGLALSGQWARIVPALERKFKAKAFLAYLQSFTNTYGPAERLAEVVAEVRGLQGLRGLCIGTRPDCVDARKLDILAGAGFEELWLEMGLQSSNDETLKRINRGHDSACFARACELAAERGVPVCAHLIAGLPGEGREEFLASVDFIAGLPVSGVKFHNLYVSRNAPLAKAWERGELALPDRSGYAAWVVEALDRLAPGTVVHRLVSDPVPGELLGPDWAADKSATLRLIQAALAEKPR